MSFRPNWVWGFKVRPIRLLPIEVTRMIAAGEVISRPLDVVRELVDNAIDAGATRIEIELVRGGFERIAVRDNGTGISDGEVEMAVLRHATSKLATLEDVHAIESLGFRGEALWSMAMAGELEVVTRPVAQLGAVRLHAHGDDVRLERTTAPAGTRITVHRLFEHLPARRETQLPKAAEYREIVTLLSRYVLHHPNLHWKLTCDGTAKLQHTAADTKSAVATVYGTLVGNRLLDIDVQSPFGVMGVLSRPELSRPQRDRMHLAVNGRPVQFLSDFEKAVLEGYGELLPSGHAPVCVLNLVVEPSRVNPNIHPSKSQVALAGLIEISEFLQEAVKTTLASHPLVRDLPSLREVTPTENENSSFPKLQVLGIYRELYIVSEGEGDLWLMDAHAAHERILYEQLELAFSTAQAVELSKPEWLKVTPATQARLLERADELAAFGLIFEDFGVGLIRVRALPAALSGLDLPDVLEILLEGALEDHPLRAILGKLACAPALKAGEITLERATTLLAQLAQCNQPWSCPHGRPTLLRLSERDLAHAFGRRSPRDVPRGRDIL